MRYNKEITIKEMLLRESAEIHAPHSSELDFYFAVKSGNVEKSQSCAKRTSQSK
ncbi:MAG: hypothetical protein K2J77_07700 [Oscillospiraceae bacterium]|nr:hypothetical protein [Oscillospiraceae bacterium]